MPDYGAIYDKVFGEHSGYQTPNYSPGFRLCIRHYHRISHLGPRHLDFGCGAGFVVELMRYQFQKDSVGVDVSPAMVEAANNRIGKPDAAFVLDRGRAPFPDGYFDFVTCFDVLEHLDYEDILSLKQETARLLRPGGTFICNISLRPSGSTDLNGDNLHRTVEAPEWWDKIFAFDEYAVDRAWSEMLGWKFIR